LLSLPLLFIPQISKPGLVARGAGNKLYTKERQQTVDPRFIAPPEASVPHTNLKVFFLFPLNKFRFPELVDFFFSKGMPF